MSTIVAAQLIESLQQFIYCSKFYNISCLQMYSCHQLKFGAKVTKNKELKRKIKSSVQLNSKCSWMTQWIWQCSPNIALPITKHTHSLNTFHTSVTFAIAWAAKTNAERCVLTIFTISRLHNKKNKLNYEGVEFRNSRFDAQPTSLQKSLILVKI